MDIPSQFGEEKIPYAQDIKNCLTPFEKIRKFLKTAWRFLREMHVYLEKLFGFGMKKMFIECIV